MAKNTNTTQNRGRGSPTTTTTVPTNEDSLVLRLCADVCNQTLNFVVNQGDVDGELVSCLVDTAELCTLTANFVARESDHVDEIKQVCAEIAKCTEEACEELEGDLFTACADACRQAYEFCNS